MKKSRKGMELSMNTIIVAVILLIVLIVLIIMFTSKMRNVNRSLNSTESQYAQNKCKVIGTGRQCVVSKDSCEERGGFIYDKPQGGWSDCPLGQECCSG